MLVLLLLLITQYYSFFYSKSKKNKILQLHCCTVLTLVLFLNKEQSKSNITRDKFMDIHFAKPKEDIMVYLKEKFEWWPSPKSTLKSNFWGHKSSPLMKIIGLWQYFMWDSKRVNYFYSSDYEGRIKLTK